MSAAPLVTVAGWVLVHFLWQGALVGCATALALTALRNARPELRYATACAGLLLCLAWPAAALVQALQADPGAPGPSASLHGLATGMAINGAAGWLAWLQAHLGWIVALWAACAGALALRMALGLAWIGRAARLDTTDPAWQARLDALAARCGVKRALRLRVVDSLASPVTAGWWRPVVLVPAALVSGMAPPLLEALLAHELGHIRRHDYLVNLLQNMIETLLFYHPAVWWISHRIRVEREQIADDFAARRLGEPRRLALALSELERLQFSGPHLAQAASGGELMARIRRLLRPDVQALDWKAALPVFGLAVAVAIACAAGAHAFTALGAREAAATRAEPAKTLVTRTALAEFDSCAKPHYPEADMAARHSGTVTLAFLVSREGAVLRSKVSRSSGHASLDEAARRAIDKCSFRPALVNGQAVERWTGVQYVWSLD